MEQTHKTHEWSTVVRWGETDTAGFVFYPNYFSWFDEASHQFFTDLGFSTRDAFFTKRVGMPLVQAHAEFQQPLYFGDAMTVLTWVGRVGTTSFRLLHHIVRGPDLIATGYEDRVWVDFAQSPPRAVSLPQAVCEALAQYQILS